MSLSFKSFSIFFFFRGFIFFLLKSSDDLGVETNIERFQWRPFKDVSNVVQQGHLWKTQGVLNLNEGENIVGSAVIRP